MAMEKAPSEFGSFFNQAVDQLIQLDNSGPDSDIDFLKHAGITPGTLPPLRSFLPPDLTEGPLEVPTTALQPLLNHSMWTFLNQGAFGAAFLPLQKVSAYWRELQMDNPVRFFDRIVLPLLVLAVRRLARFVNVSQKQVFLFPNATYGLNICMMNLRSKVRQVVLLSTSYGSTKKMASHYYGESAVTQIPVPMKMVREWKTADDVLAWWNSVLRKITAGGEDGKGLLIILEAITSAASLMWPMDDMARAARSHFGSRAIIVGDGAHHLGMAPVDLRATMVEANIMDAWITNCHKWFGAPSGTGVLVLSERGKAMVTEPFIVSHGIQQSFLSKTIWRGHLDYAPALSVIHGVELWERYLVPEVMAKVRGMADRGERLLQQHWGTPQVLPPFLCSPLMRLVELPSEVSRRYGGRSAQLQDHLHHKYRIEVPIKDIDGTLYVRVSTGLFTTEDHYLKLAQAILDLSAKNSSL